MLKFWQKSFVLLLIKQQMLFFGHLVILVAIYSSNFRILQTKPVKNALNKESLYKISSKLDKEISGGIREDS